MSIRIYFLPALLSGFFLLGIAALAQPMLPHSISGTIYNSSGLQQVPLGTSFSINDSISGFYLKSRTSVPVPGLSGRYFETINGSDGDIAILHAWNATHYGTTNFTLQGDMENVNIYINLSRPGEANTSIRHPSNNTQVNVTMAFNVTANITIIGNSASLQCIATLAILDQNIINITPADNFTHQLGNINPGSSNITVWNLTGNFIGSSNLSVIAACLDESINLEKSAQAAVSNITVTDAIPPVIRLMAPANNTLSTSSVINFAYNVSDSSPLANCSLLINSIYNASNASAVQRSTLQTITSTLDDGTYNWSIACYDIAGNYNVSGFYNVSINSSGPHFSAIVVSNPITLNAGTTSKAWCNATITPPGLTNLTIFNATLFDTTASSYDAPDDNNDHYTNTSCANVTANAVTGALNVSCQFIMWYYSNNASWRCDMRASDTNNATSAAAVPTLVEELLAINSTALIEYGDLEVGEISEERNVTLFNLGNIPINITAYGYARKVGDNLSLMCGQNSEGGNISVGYQRHYAVFSNPYSQMTPLANASNQSQILNLTIWQRTLDSGHTNDQNNSYWKLLVPETVGGACNGTVILTAIAANLTG